MRVHHELRPRRGARRGEQVRWLVGFHVRAASVATGSGRDEIFPPDVAPRRHGRLGGGAAKHDDALDQTAGELEGSVHQLLQPDVLALAIAGIAGEHHLRPARVDAVGNCARAKAGEHHVVDRAHAHAGEHRHHPLHRHGHVDGDAVAATHAIGTQCGGEARHTMQELRVRQHAPVAPLVRVDNRGVPATPIAHVPVERVVTQVRLAALEPGEGRRVGAEHRIPRAEPLHRLGGVCPEFVRTLGGVTLPAPHDGIHDIHLPALQRGRAALTM